MLRFALVLVVLAPGLAAAQTATEHTLRHQNLDRRYVVHVPSGYDGSRAVPVVLVLHGGGGSADAVQRFTEMNPVSEANGFLAVYPEGGAPNANGFAWADGRGTDADRQGIDDVGFLSAVVEDIATIYTVDRDSVYLSGFSNGGFLTQRMACEENDLFAAMASLGSTQDVGLNAVCAPGRPVPMMIVTGTADPLVPYDGGAMGRGMPDIVSTADLLAFWATSNGCATATDTLDLPDIVLDDGSTVTSFGFTDCIRGADVRHLRINGGGHTWPGVELVGLEDQLGQTNEDIDGSRTLWAFFSRHRRAGVETQAEPAASAPALRLLGVRPNPTRGRASVAFELATTRTVRLDLFDALGRHLATRTERHLGPGEHRIVLEPTRPAGVYLYRIQTGASSVVGRVVWAD